MSTVAEIQSAIAIIRKHRAATRGGIDAFVAGEADAQRVAPNGRAQSLRRYAPGTILDAPGTIEYEFPPRS
ncbi:MAG: hypothetical protein QM811_18810 [Pirellulales bacterium]